MKDQKRTMIHQLHKTWKGRLQLFCCLPYEEKMCLNWREMIVRSSIRHYCWDNKLHVQHAGSQTCITPSVVSNGVDVEVHRWLWLIALWFLHQSFLSLLFVFLKEAVITCKKKTTACVEGNISGRAHCSFVHDNGAGSSFFTFFDSVSCSAQNGFEYTFAIWM